jgi:hypothetical protein
MAGGMTGMYGRYTGPMTDRAEYEDLLGGQPITGGDAFSQALVEDMLLGTGQQYSPGGIDAGPMFPGTGDPVQDYIQMQLAGDVVPMYGAGSVPSAVIQDRLSAPGAYMGSRGAASINQAGGRENPYLDLLNILAFPGGGSMAPPIRRR